MTRIPQPVLGLLIAAGLCGVPHTAAGQLAPSDQGSTYGALAVEKLAVTLTGRSASAVVAPATLSAYRAGNVTLGEVADQLVKQPAFVDRFAQYWLQILQVGSLVSWWDVVDPTAPATAVNASNLEKTLINIIQYGNYGSTTRRLAYARDTCNVNGWTKGTFIIYTNAATAPDLNCSNDCGRTTLVTPYWNPTGTVQVCSGLLASDHCGPDLARCIPDPEPVAPGYTLAPFVRQVSWGFTMQPGVTAAKLVQDGASWDGMVTGTRVPVNGPMAKFLSLFGGYFGAVAPPGAYPGRTSDAVFTGADATNLDDWRWVEGGPREAGILTSLAFQRVTNGWRAKANRAMNALLCRSFSVPEGTPQPPSTETDLTKKPYCSECHRILEPMARFFGRWPNVGNGNNYRYDPVAPAAGEFNGVTGDDVPAFGRILAGMEDYDRCAVRRAFEFVMARRMTDEERATLLRPLTARFVANGKRLWPVMRELIASPAFQAPLN